MKTPTFDNALADYFAKLQLDEKGGQERMCRASGEKFYVRPEDIAFYKKVGVPLPTLSPIERMRKRFASLNSYNLFKNTSALTGKPIVSTHPPKTPFKIYEHQAWFGNEWDPFEFGRAWDPQKDFFAQIAELQKEVPRPNLLSDTSNVNSDFTNTSVRLKNCYLAFDAMEGENLYYFYCCTHNQDCVDCDSLFDSSECYECLWGIKLYNCQFCELTEDSIESAFLYDCRHCTNCFGGVNLRNKKYVFFGEQLSKEAYEKRMKDIDLSDYETLETYKKKFEELKKTAIHPALHIKNAVNCYGEFINNSKNCYFAYWLIDSEDVAYSLGSIGLKDSYDVCGGGGAERCYEVTTVSTEHNYNIKFSSMINESRDLEYCDLMRNCHDCFGCIGLSDRSFCIFNKQYAEGEYWKVVDEIKTTMLKSGEYGEAFPPSLAPYPYNVSYAMSFRGFDDVALAERYGYHLENIEHDEGYAGETIASDQLPKNIREVDDTILTKVILDTESGKKFRITPYELSFYRKHKLSLPRRHPDVRGNRRRRYWYVKMDFCERTCARCGKAAQSYRDPEGPTAIYCLDCYNAAVA